MHIPNLTKDEVTEMYRWYEKESGQKVEQIVIDELFKETCGQPGLVSWFGELLTETFYEKPDEPIILSNWKNAYSLSYQTLHNNTVLNIISKAEQKEYKGTVLEFYKTSEKYGFFIS